MYDLTEMFFLQWKLNCLKCATRNVLNTAQMQIKKILEADDIHENVKMKRNFL